MAVLGYTCSTILGVCDICHGTHALRILRVQKRLLRVHKDSNVQERGFYVVLGSKREDEHE